VNYYFRWIVEGLKRFAEINNLAFNIRSGKNGFHFCLTHDVDNLNYYTWPYLGYKIKEFFGLVKSQYSRSTTLKLLLNGAFQYLNFVNQKNPQWNFPFHIELENKLGIRSTYFFLQKGVKHADAYFDIREKRVVELFRRLKEGGFEIGLHGTVKSGYSQEVFNQNMQNMETVAGKIQGNRQHRLIYRIPGTAIIHENSGLTYDATLGFAGHEGFRNGYCHPFKLYDFDNERMIDVWQMPLNAMDVTLMDYRKLSFDEVDKSINKMIEEIEKFNGVFVLLWHIGYFDEIRFPGIQAFYIQLLENIMNRKPLASTAIEYIHSFSKRIVPAK
jgi:hypothetical protein